MSGYNKRNNLFVPSLGVYNATSLAGGLVGTDRTGAAISISSTFSWEGSTSYELTAGTSGNFDIYVNTAVNFYGIKSNSYTLSAFVRRDDGGSIVNTDITGVDIYTTVDTNSTVSAIAVPDVNNWFRIVGARSGLIGTGVVDLTRIRFSAGGNLIGHTLYIDAWQLECGPFATPWEGILVGDRQHNKWKSK